MIELLRSQVGAQSLRSYLRASAQREAARVAKPLRSALPFLGLSLGLGALVVLFALYTPCYSMSVNGVQTGVVQNRTLVADTITQVEAQVGRILGQEYHLPTNLSFDLTIAAKADLQGKSRVADVLMDSVPDIKSAYVLSVDGQELGAAAEKQTLDAVLRQLRTPYINERTKAHSFANEARITRKYIPSEAAFPHETSLLASLSEQVSADTMYEVAQGDTLASLAAQFGMSQDALLAKNPKLAEQKTLLSGQIITVEKTLPRLSVSTTEEVLYQKELPSPIREQKDESLYEGESRVLVQGSAGLETLRSNMNYVNGVFQYEEVLARQTLSEPTETVLALGSRARPAYYGTGRLQWPTQGRITSPFGYRNIFGGSSFHSGMDIANSYGTPIYAADNGIVTFVGYKGSYGNLIIIDHGNGFETYYSHSATNGVSLGQGVGKGDYIASMGATGRATGKHCHFEVRINGEAVNPANYLPS